MYIDLKNAKKEFEKYVENYDAKNKKIALKIKHTYKVMEVSGKLAKSLGLNEEDIEIATLIGLLHDIGRFEQVKRYNTFVDKKSVNHGELGAEILFKENLIRKFVSDDKYDEIIKISILNHNAKCIQSGLTERQVLFCKIIRDADKIDIFRVLVENAEEEVYNCDLEENLKISKPVLQDFIEHRLIDYSKRETRFDDVICHIAYIFDLYFNYSVKIIKQEKYVEQLLDKMTFTTNNAKSQKQMIINSANDYMEKRLA